MSVIGKRFGDAWLQDIAIESGVVAECSVKSVLCGKQYSRAVRFHKLLYEACMRLIWKCFLDWLISEGSSGLSDVDELNSLVDSLSNEYSPENV